MGHRALLSTLSAVGALLIMGPVAAGTATLIQTIDTSQFSPPSPDPSGLAYLTATGTLLDCDGEVDEMPIYQGVNLFQLTPSGNLVAGSNTLAYSNEPVGCAYNPVNGHLFISDDDKNKVFEINPGNDGILFTADDTRTSITTTQYGSGDAEGLAFNPGGPGTADDTLFIVDGVNAEVYLVTPGPDGVFDGTGETSTHFDTAALGLLDPEGGEYKLDDGHLYLVGEPVGTLFKLTTAGTVADTFSISTANPKKTAGLAAAPGSLGASDPTPGVDNIFIADRRVDNNTNPNENDGKIYEFSVPGAPPGNQPPSVSAGPDQVIISPASAALDGTVTDDGPVTTLWSQVSGPDPGIVTFADAAAVDTTASFSTVGVYVLRLTADDGEFLVSNDVQITVNAPASVSVIYVSTASGGTVSGIAFADEDVLAYDTATGIWSLYFDGSDVGLGASGNDVEAFHRQADGSILLGFTEPVTITVSGVSTLIDDSDIVRFIPTSLGSNTAGSFEWYFDGSDVELVDSAEDIDALGFAPDGRLLLSTSGSPVVTGVSGGKDEDLLAFTATTLGEATSGTWALYFDGSDVALSQASSEDIDGASVEATSGNIHLNTRGAYSVPGLSGDGNDIVTCIPGSTGTNTTCTYSLLWDGGANGLGTNNVDAFDLQ